MQLQGTSHAPPSHFFPSSYHGEAVLQSHDECDKDGDLLILGVEGGGSLDTPHGSRGMHRKPQLSVPDESPGASSRSSSQASSWRPYSICARTGAGAGTGYWVLGTGHWVLSTGYWCW